MYRGGERTQGEGERDLGGLPAQGGGRGRGVPAEKEQLRRNLSLLKKKMHSQAGSRRSQVRVRLALVGVIVVFPYPTRGGYGVLV